MEVRTVLISKIKVGDRFREDLGDMEELQESISQKGLIQPITVTKDLHLVCGERRLCACQGLGMKKIDVIIRNVDGEADARELELVENIARKDMTWHERATLESRIWELRTQADPNWSQRKQAKLLDQSKGSVHRRLVLADALEMIPELKDSKNENDAWKKYKSLEEDAVVHQLSRSGSKEYKHAAKWARDHYIIGDAFEGLEQVSAGTVDFMEVDPPYGIDIVTRKSRSDDKSKTDKYSEILARDYPAFLAKLSKLIYKKMKDNTFCIWWYGMTWHEVVRETLKKSGFQVNDIPALWVKSRIAGQSASPDTMLGSAYEPFFVCRKKMPKLRKAGRANVFEFQPTAPSNKIHATEKPVVLMEEILETFTFPGSIVCSPFLGSGATLRAVYKSQMTGYGWDLDKSIKERFLAKVMADMMEESVK